MALPVCISNIAYARSAPRVVERAVVSCTSLAMQSTSARNVVKSFHALSLNLGSGQRIHFFIGSRYRVLRCITSPAILVMVREYDTLRSRSRHLAMRSLTFCVASLSGPFLRLNTDQMRCIRSTMLSSSSETFDVCLCMCQATVEHPSFSSDIVVRLWVWSYDGVLSMSRVWDTASCDRFIMRLYRALF